MEAQSSSSSSAYLLLQDPREVKGIKQSNISIHSVRKTQTKPWRKPLAPLPPAPTRVYKVDRMDFREVVQKLTGAPEFQPQPQQNQRIAAVPPLEMANPTFSHQDFMPLVTNSVLPDMSQDFVSEPVETRVPQKSHDNAMVSSFLGMNSPSTLHNWVPLLSPRSLLSHLQDSSVL